MQTMDPKDEDKFDFDPLDVTKIWPEHLLPLQPVGRMVLNKNPDNFFTENEQLAFCPALVVPGTQSASLPYNVNGYLPNAEPYRRDQILLFSLLMT